MQGTTLQGTSTVMQMQGTSLQGTSTVMQLQGTSLQGTSTLVQMQGTSLQGTSTVMQLQGTTLQGTSTVTQMQGTRLQGTSTVMTQQGTSLHGADGGLQRKGQLRAYRGLADLNGARLTIEADPTNTVTLQNGQLVARGFADTVSLKGVALAAVAPDGRPFHVTITGVTQDTRTERIQILVDGFPACQPNMHGVFVAGRWDARAAHVEDPAVVTYSCTDGVIAKCVDWGYAPWLTDGSVHAACTRLARADYCGNGTPWTMDGTPINVYDQLGIQTPLDDQDLKFEAAWSPDGAVCIGKSRYEIEDQAGHSVLPGCFATLPKCHSIEEGVALGAMLANRSKVMPIEACH
jgi:hypothetical protein